MKLAVLGVGLIGGSIGLAARGRLGAHVRGWDPDPAVLASALRLGAIDEAANEVAGAVEDAELVFVAAPVGALATLVRQALAAAGPDCAVSDVGSTKRALAEAVQDERFIGGHPLAGAETGGVEHARADLFDGAVWYLTPGAHAALPLLERLSDMIVTLGAKPLRLQADAHDRLMASLSHLPHVFANVLVSGAVEALAGNGGPADAGPSFRDATRVAGANTAIWADIYMSNSDALIDAIDDAIRRLGEVRAALAGHDAAALAAWNDRARADRERLR
jgi:prephenate dehydrogenase